MAMRRGLLPGGDRALVVWLRTGALPGDDESFDAWWVVDDPAALRAVWQTVGAAIVMAWAREYPGTRPAAWWWFESPEPCRRRVGGVGDDYAAAGWQQQWAFGLPRYWLNAWLCAYYRGEAVTVHGVPVGVEYRARVPRWPHVGIDPRDPPRFESQAAFLARHGLLSAAERRRLTPAAFTPDVIPIDVEGEDL